MHPACETVACAVHVQSWATGQHIHYSIVRNRVCNTPQRVMLMVMPVPKPLRCPAMTSGLLALWRLQLQISQDVFAVRGCPLAAPHTPTFNEFTFSSTPYQVGMLAVPR